MIGTPIPDPRIKISRDLGAQIDRFFAAGKSVVVVEPGASGQKIGVGMERHHAKLRAERDKDAPTLRDLADQGCTVKQASEAMGTCEKRIRLIARENNITFGGPL